MICAILNKKPCLRAVLIALISKPVDLRAFLLYNKNIGVL